MALQVTAFEGTSAEWDAAARGFAGWTHFHLYGWRRVMESALGHECVYLAVRASGCSRLRGLLPLVRVRSVLFGHYLVSMPFLNYGGPLGDDDAVRALVTAAVDQAVRDGADLLELRAGQRLPLELAASHRKITVVLDLPSREPGALWEGLPSKVRSQVRRPMKEGVQVRFGLDQLPAFYGVFSRHMRDLGTPVLSHRVFETMADAFPNDVWFGAAWLGDRPIAGGCGLRWGGEFEMTWASSLRSHSRIAPNMLLYWCFLERCAAEGVSVFNFGRCSPGSTTHRFKGQWGGRDVPLHWYHHGSRGAEATPSPGDRKYRLATSIWSRLPLSLTNRLGPQVVRLIP